MNNSIKKNGPFSQMVKTQSLTLLTESNSCLGFSIALFSHPAPDTLPSQNGFLL